MRCGEGSVCGGPLLLIDRAGGRDYIGRMSSALPIAFIGTVNPIGAIIILVLVVLVFGGRGKISAIMGDLGKGITSFRKGLKEDSADAATVDPAEEAIDVTPPRKD